MDNRSSIMDNRSSIAQRVLNRRRRKRDPDVFFVDIAERRGSVPLSSRGPESRSKKKVRRSKDGSFMDNAEVIEIRSSGSESESGSDEDSGSHSGFRECSASASSDKNPDGDGSSAAVAADEEEPEEVIHVVVDDETVSDLSSSCGESERDDLDADGEQGGSDNEAEPRSTGKEISLHSEKEKKTSMEEEGEVGGCETPSPVTYLRKGKRVMNHDDDTDPHDHGNKLRAEKDGFGLMKNPKDFDVGEEASADEVPSADEMGYLWAGMNRSLAPSQIGNTSSLDSNQGNENDETNANQEEEEEEEESDDQVPAKSDYKSETDYLWAEMDRSLASSQIGNTSSLQGNENDETNANQATLCEHDFVLDEEIGKRCRRCSLVEIEIKDFIQPMDKFAAERWGHRSSYAEEDINAFGGIKFQAFTSNPQETGDYAQGTVWDLIPGIRKDMFEHQREGFEFIWKNLAGTIMLDELKGNCNPKQVVGCIVSHGPGTGKTKLSLTFLQSFLKKFESCKPVIVAPAGMLLTWEGEFRKWNIGVPFHNLNNPDSSGNEMNMMELGRPHQGDTKNLIRMVKLQSWKMQKSILGISYDLYKKLAGGNFVCGKGTTNRKKAALRKEWEEMRKMLFELPSLLVLDEGHTPRNKRSQIWQVLSKVQAQRRIILSGTPFQNNFEELYNVISLVRPKLARKILASLTKSGNKIGVEDDRIEKLKDLISPFVHHKGGILENNLPGLRSCIVGFNPSDLQKELLVKIQSTPNNFDFEHKESLVAIHPSLLLDCGLSNEEESSVDWDMLQSLTVNPNEGAKTRFLVEFIRLCNAIDEKVLVFSQYIDPLNFIVKQLHSLFGWSEGREVLLMHGKLQQRQRQALINGFNDPTHKSRVLIASTKACSEGINLIGASRVVLLDVMWNPSVVRQAISRAYRLGQKRVVYSYHLITRGTTEWDKYRKQAEKDRIAEMVFTSTSKGSCEGHAAWEDDVLGEMVGHEKLKGLFEKVIYQPKGSNLVESFGH